jgi:hypothetical protein
MPADGSRSRLTRELLRSEQELPAQLAGGVGILPRQGVGQGHADHAAGQVTVVQRPPVVDPRRQRRPQLARQHDDPIFVALAAPHQDLAAFQVEVLDAQAAAFQPPQPRAVEQIRPETVSTRGPLDRLQHAPDFVA